MSKDTRKFKVDELNRILPMVRETIRKYKKNSKLKEKLDKKVELQKEIQNQLDDMMRVRKLISEMSELTDSSKKEFELLCESKMINKKNYMSEIEGLEREISKLNSEKYEEDRFYSAISWVLSKYEDLFLAEDIKGEFLDEYVYLFCLETQLKEGKLELQKHFTDEARYAFYSLIDERFANRKGDVANELKTDLTYHRPDGLTFYRYFMEE